jgi:hypothetical protein
VRPRLSVTLTLALLVGALVGGALVGYGELTHWRDGNTFWIVGSVIALVVGGLVGAYVIRDRLRPDWPLVFAHALLALMGSLIVQAIATVVLLSEGILID